MPIIQIVIKNLGLGLNGGAMAAAIAEGVSAAYANASDIANQEWNQAALAWDGTTDTYTAPAAATVDTLFAQAGTKPNATPMRFGQVACLVIGPLDPTGLDLSSVTKV